MDTRSGSAGVHAGMRRWFRHGGSEARKRSPAAAPTLRIVRTGPSQRSRRGNGLSAHLPRKRLSARLPRVRSAPAITCTASIATTSPAAACGAAPIKKSVRTASASEAARKEIAMPNKISTVRESLYRCIDTTFCCEKCAYRGKSRCMRALMIDAFDAIGALNRGNDQLRTQLRQAAAGADRLSVFERIAQYFRRRRRHDK